jgi:hypothetical protein
MRRIVFLLLLLAGCGFERRSPQFTCTSPDDCSDGRVCREGFCVQNGDAGAPGDGAPGDAFVCPAICTSCDQGTCVIDCNGSSACGQQVVCPVGMACRVSCGASACGNGIDCSGATSCTISCNQSSSCGSALVCGSGPCAIQCDGQSSCAGHIDCSSSCKCDTACSGAGSCPFQSTCPGPAACREGNACTSAPGACHGC